MTVESFKKGMQRHYRQFRFMNESGKWVRHELWKLDSRLMPKDLTMEQVNQFIDHMVIAAEANPYLTDFLEQAENQYFEHLQNKVETEGAKVFPSVVAYAFVLEALTVVMREDYTLSAVFKKIWKKHRINEGFYKQMIPFEISKLFTLEFAFHRIRKQFKKGIVPGSTLKVILPLNILEAIAEDVRIGNRSNAISGWPIAVHAPGTKKLNPQTGAGPTHFSDDGKTLLFCMSLPKEWADLYTTWNLAFVSHYHDFPFMMAKLLIPQVNDFQDAPEEYICNRGNSLYLHINHTIFGRVDRANAGQPEMNWKEESLSLLWGKVNRESAKKYNNEVKNRDPSILNKLKAMIR